MSGGLESLPARTLRQRIGGRWGLAWQAFAVTAALGVFSLFAGEQYSTTSTEVFLTWLALGIAGTAALGVFFIFLDLTIFRNRREHPLPVWVVVVADGIFGVIFSVVVGGGAAYFDLETNTTFVQRIVLNALYAMWWGPALAYFLDYREEALKTRQALIDSAVNLHIAELQRSEIVERLHQEILDEVGDELSPVRTHITEYLESTGHSDQLTRRTGAPPTEDWRSISQLLMGTAQDSVRPLSKRLWQVGVKRYPKTPWWALVQNIFRHQPFRPLAYAVVDILGTLAVYLNVFGFSQGLFIIFGGLAITVSLLLAANALMLRYPQHHSMIFIGTIVVLQVTVIFRTVFREMWIPGSAPLSWQLTQVIAGVVVIFVTSGFGAWRAKDRELQTNFKAEIQLDQIEAIAQSRQVATLALESAQILHGAVQTRLVACAMMIDQASKDGDESKLNLALEEALNILHNPLPGEKRSGSVTDEVSRKTALWDGLCECDINISPEANTTSLSTVITLGRVVEEGISNAIRHGQATRITITITMSPESNYQVCLQDNGLGPTKSTPGMGSAYLTQVSNGQWSLSAGQQGSDLLVTVLA